MTGGLGGGLIVGVLGGGSTVLEGGGVGTLGVGLGTGVVVLGNLGSYAPVHKSILNLPMIPFHDG